MNPDSRPVLPDPPAAPVLQDAPRRAQEPRRRPFRAALVVTLGITCMGFAGAFVASTQPSSAGADDKPPVVSQPVTLTQETLDAKMDRVAFYLGRGQVEGANQILSDTIKGTGCAYVTSGAGAYKTRAYALKIARLWSHSIIGQAEGHIPEGTELLIGSGLAKTEDDGTAVATVLHAAEGRWVTAAVALFCPVP